MIVRILGEGQFDVPDEDIAGLNVLDDKLQQAIEASDETSFRAALTDLLNRVREIGRAVPVEELVSSKLILPGPDASLEEVRDLLSDDGLIPG
jgi:hypothetical protein